MSSNNIPLLKGKALRCPSEGKGFGLNLFIIGPSGCGKSTQAKLVADKYGLTHLSMGQLLRDEIEAKTSLGLQAKSYIDQGIWVSDDLIFDVLTPHLEKLNNENFIVDGFPRVLNQGKIIEHYLKTKEKPFSLLIHLDVTVEEIQARRAKMGAEFQDQNRTDNTPEAVKQRQLSYLETVNPIKDYFRSLGKLFDVNGNRPIEPIFEDICRAIDDIQEKDEEIEILDEETSREVEASMEDFKHGRFKTFKTVEEFMDYFNKLK